MDILLDWARFLLCILAVLSFVPQLQSLLQNKDSSGISLCYILFNLLSATEQFALSLCLDLEHDGSTAHWIDKVHWAAVMAMYLALFALCIEYSPSPRNKKNTAVVLYAVYFLLVFVPLYAAYGAKRDLGQSIFNAFFIFFPHAFVLMGAATLLGAYPIFCQMDNSHALNERGLALQAAVFALVAASWPFRLTSRAGGVEMTRLSWWVLMYAYQGKPFLDNGIFAVGQFWLFCHARQQQRQLKEEVDFHALPLKASERECPVSALKCTE